MLLALVLSCTLLISCSEKVTETQKYTIDNIRSYIVGIDEPVELSDGKTQPLINFDNAATTPALQPVADAVDEELKMYDSIGRGFSQKSNHSTDLYNATRDKVLQFVGADPEQYTCFYVNNTTDGLNKLASALVQSGNDLILCTRMEHHANDLSWRERCKVIYAEVDEQGRVIYDDIERLLQENDGKVKYVSITAITQGTVPMSLSQAPKRYGWDEYSLNNVLEWQLWNLGADNALKRVHQTSRGNSSAFTGYSVYLLR